MASGAPSSPRITLRWPTRTPATSVMALRDPGSPLPIRIPRSRARGWVVTASYDTCSIMGILGLGVSFRRAPVELLERLAFTDDDLTKAYRLPVDQPGLGGGGGFAHWHTAQS